MAELLLLIKLSLNKDQIGMMVIATENVVVIVTVIEIIEVEVVEDLVMEDALIVASLVILLGSALVKGGEGEGMVAEKVDMVEAVAVVVTMVLIETEIVLLVVAAGMLAVVEILEMIDTTVIVIVLDRMNENDVDLEAIADILWSFY
jgi:hypothetical protein